MFIKTILLLKTNDLIFFVVGVLTYMQDILIAKAKNIQSKVENEMGEM